MSAAELALRLPADAETPRRRIYGGLKPETSPLLEERGVSPVLLVDPGTYLWQVVNGLYGRHLGA